MTTKTKQPRKPQPETKRQAERPSLAMDSPAPEGRKVLQEEARVHPGDWMALMIFLFCFLLVGVLDWYSLILGLFSR